MLLTCLIGKLTSINLRKQGWIREVKYISQHPQNLIRQGLCSMMTKTNPSSRAQSRNYHRINLLSSSPRKDFKTSQIAHIWTNLTTPRACVTIVITCRVENQRQLCASIMIGNSMLEAFVISVIASSSTQRPNLRHF